MNRVIEILMRRDNMSYEDAKELVDETREEMITNPDEAEDILQDCLGLEPDYIMDVLY